MRPESFQVNPDISGSKVLKKKILKDFPLIDTGVPIVATP
jgi:hypothetical protein